MRYIKVLLLAIFLFLAMVFFFQNQAALSHQVELNMNLFFIPPMTSIPLPFYFIVIAAFFVGCILALCMLAWDRFTITAKAMKRQWEINNLQKEVTALQKKVADEATTFAEVEKTVSENAPAVTLKKPA